ncbi:hypothetical protein B1B_03146, partial [mine drainage metagenome]
RFAGITDAWGYTDGHTKTTVNYAQAAYGALVALSEIKVASEDSDRLKIVRGGVGTSILPPKEDGPRPMGGRGGRGRRRPMGGPRGGRPPGRGPGGPSRGSATRPPAPTGGG